jgi:phasin family protein
VGIELEYWGFLELSNINLSSGGEIMQERAARNFAQKATDETLDQMERSKASAQEGTMIVEQSYVRASKGAIDFNLKLMGIAQDNVNVAFDFARELFQVKSPSAFIELSTKYARQQLERLTDQARELTGVAQDAMTETTQSLQKGATRRI